MKEPVRQRLGTKDRRGREARVRAAARGRRRERDRESKLQRAAGKSCMHLLIPISFLKKAHQLYVFYWFKASLARNPIRHTVENKGLSELDFPPKTCRLHVGLIHVYSSLDRSRYACSMW